TIIGLSPSNRAARELEQGSGVKCYTLDRFLYDQERSFVDTWKHHGRMIVRAAFGLKTWKPPKIEIGKRTTIVVDECSMADNEKLKKVLDHAQRNGCRVVLLGDQRQLPAIQQGGLFREIYERAAPNAKAALSEIVRQREGWTKSAIESFGRG